MSERENGVGGRGRGSNFKFCSLETSSKPNPGNPGAPHHAEFRDGYSKERDECLQRLRKGRE